LPASWIYRLISGAPPKARPFGDAEATGKILPASHPGAAKARVGR
jgi:hypothetical protein